MLLNIHRDIKIIPEEVIEELRKNTQENYSYNICKLRLFLSLYLINTDV